MSEELVFNQKKQNAGARAAQEALSSPLPHARRSLLLAGASGHHGGLGLLERGPQPPTRGQHTHIPQHHGLGDTICPSGEADGVTAGVSQSANDTHALLRTGFAGSSCLSNVRQRQQGLSFEALLFHFW